MIVARRVRWLRQLARPEQIPDDDDNSWNTYLVLAGRGWGKTRTAAEWLAFQAISYPKTRWAIVAPTYGDARDTCAEGISGIVGVLREYGVLKTYNRSNGEMILTNNSRIKLYSGEEPDRLRGPQFHGGWFDELASFKSTDAFDQYRFALRLGDRPRTIITTTPRPTKAIKDLSKRDDVLLIRGATFDNAANLSEVALAEMRHRYEGTRLGRQELYGEIIDDVEGALWTRDVIEANRVSETPPLVRVVVGVDPAVTSGENSDMTGIVVAGVTADGHYYILEDISMRGSPDEWARRVVDAYHRHQADRIIGETNNGGDMIEILLRQVDSTISYKKVTATRGKLIRAEPVSALYEQHRAHHAGGFPELEDQMCNWTPDSGESPDRMDAMVWAVTELMANQTAMMGIAALAQFCSACRMPAPKSATVCPNCHAPLGE